ncbi:MAG: polyketide cyclase [Nitrospirales bacterium]|nr:MAG: polyketide cyclase [Nitrospirales bacterium]
MVSDRLVIKVPLFLYAMQSKYTHTVWDISLPISSKTIVYPGDSSPRLTNTSDIEKGDRLTASQLSMNCHIGTHVDAPAHFLGDGETLDELSLNRFHGPAVVYEFLDRDVITQDDIQNVSIPERQHILLKTKNSALLQRDAFSSTYCTVSPTVAEWLRALQPLSVGFDYYSLDPYHVEGGHLAHMVFARAGIPTYVCLNLLDVPAGEYLFSGFPLRLAGAEASPVRAVLMQTGERGLLSENHSSEGT